MSLKKFVISSIIPNATYNKECLETLKRVANENGAELLLLETAANSVSDIKFEEYIQQLDEIKEHLVDNGISLCNKLSISPISSNINVIDPTSGMDSLVAKIGNIIIPFPRHRMRMVSRMLKDHKSPRGIWCTGTISDKYYKQTKGGITAAQYHVYGGIIVEVNEDETFSVRQLTWDGSGIYDMTNHYTPKATKTGIRASAISLPDTHVPFINQIVLKQIKQSLKTFNPEVIVHHDVFDAQSISHHLINKNISKANINLTLEQEGRLTSDYLKDIIESSPKSIHYLCASNHHEHLDKYLEEGRYIKDYPNHNLGLELALVKAHNKNPLEHLLSKFNTLERLVICNRSSSLKINNIELLCHGDQGSSGSKGTPNGVSLVYGGLVTTGHTHSNEITPYGGYVTGTMTDLILDYTDPSGGSKWTHGYVVQYPNGSRSNIIIL